MLGDIAIATGDANSARAVARCNEGRRFWEKGQLDRAADAVSQAVAADATYGPAQNNLGLVQFELGDLYAAAWSFQRVRFTPAWERSAINQNDSRICQI